MSKRVHLFANKTVDGLRTEFWNAPSNALLDRKTTAAGIGYSPGWMEIKAITGGGIPFHKVGRRCLYRKSDALAWLKENSKYVRTTSEYKSEE